MASNGPCRNPTVDKSLFADAHLRFALTGISPPRLQSQIATHVPAFAETMGVFQGQQERQCDQCAYSLDLLQQRYLRITLLRQRLDAFVVLADPFAQLLDSLTAMAPVLLAVPDLTLRLFPD